MEHLAKPVNQVPAPISTPKLDWLHGLRDFDIAGEIKLAGTSKVFRAISNRGRLKDRVLALKVTSLPRDGNLQQTLHHPNIVSLFSHFAEPCGYVQVMEYCGGGCLGDLLQSLPGSTLDQETLRDFLRNVTSALIYIGSLGILHRNIEPANVLLSSNQIFKLSKFANAVSVLGEGYTRTACRAISSYSAPEIIAQESHSFPCDIWSLGRVLLFCTLGPSSTTGDLEGSSVFRTDSTLSLSCRASGFHELLSALLQINPEDRISATQLLAHPWLQTPSSPPTQCDLTEDASLALAEGTAESPAATLAASEGYDLDVQVVSPVVKKPSLNESRRMPASVSLGRRVTSEPLFGQPSLNASALRRAKSESIRRERLTQFFLKSTPTFRIGSLHNPPSPCRAADSKVSRDSKRRECATLSVLSPNEYRFSQGIITVLPSRWFVIDFPYGTNRGRELELLLVKPALNKVEIHAAVGGPVRLERLGSPKRDYIIEALPEPYNEVYQQALGRLEELKERTPRLTLHLVDGKCMMMSNVPLPDVEILVRSSPSELPSSKTMLRVRLLRRTMRLEIARRTSHDLASEWVKRVVTCKAAFPFLTGDEWGTLDDLEQRALKVLEKFLPVCDGALELGLQAEDMDMHSGDRWCEDDGSTLDSDFTPNFVPDLVSSLPPRPIHKTHFGTGTLR